MSTFQCAEVTATTDSSGYLSYSFSGSIDKAMVSVNQPQAGTGTGIVGASVTVTGANSVKVRCWKAEGGTNLCKALGSVQVTVTLLGILG